MDWTIVLTPLAGVTLDLGSGGVNWGLRMGTRGAKGGERGEYREAKTHRMFLVSR